MKKKKVDLNCTECGLSYLVSHANKDAVSYCPFCGEETHEKKDEPPLLKDFDEMDEFEEDNDDDFWQDDSRSDDEE